MFLFCTVINRAVMVWFCFFTSEYFPREILQVVQLDHRVTIGRYSQKALLRGVPSFSRVWES